MKPLLAVGLLLVAVCLPLRAEDDARARVLFDKLLAAQDAKDYDAFVADATDELKGGLSKTQFEAASNVMIARAAGGQKVTFLGELNQQGYEVYLYRLRFKDSDMLGTMMLKDGKVAGIYFK
jgi:hypothetical protein